jgi:hypothetical protein
MKKWKGEIKTDIEYSRDSIKALQRLDNPHKALYTVSAMPEKP